MPLTKKDYDLERFKKYSSLFKIETKGTENYAMYSTWFLKEFNTLSNRLQNDPLVEAEFNKELKIILEDAVFTKIDFKKEINGKELDFQSELAALKVKLTQAKNLSKNLTATSNS